MKAFEFDRHLVEAYSRFSRSFTTVHPRDLAAVIDRAYSDGRFWPEDLLSLNPRYLKGPVVEDLVASGELDAATGSVFCFDGVPRRFHRHQGEAITKARVRQSFIVTTGTGSGKSTCFSSGVPPLCIGTSAAMASDGSDERRAH